uniref:polysaccharide biosynthesis C-terminal domain-containing protein n=1 Tax=Paenibacillus zanthoxyli TaxID=369399 RepID=UPI00046FCBF9
FAIMLYAAIQMKRSDKQSGIHASSEAKLPLLGIYKDIFSLSIPIILSSMTIQAVYFIDSSLIVPLLSGQVGGTEATRLLGILGQKAQSIAGIPPVLAIALSTSLIPVISAAYARRDEVHLKRQITLAMRIAILTGTPIVLSLVVAAYSVNGLLFSTPSGSGMIALLTLGTIFQITMTTSNSILLGMGKSRISMFYVLAGIIVKLAGSVLLSRFMGIYGIIIATALCFIVITALNLRLLRSIVPFEIMGKRWRGYLLAVLVSGAAGYGLNVAAISLTGMMPARLAYLVGCLAAGAVVVILYLVLLIVLGVLSAGELASYPRPVRKLLNPLMKLQPARVRERE